MGSRRAFLQAVALGGAIAAPGCSSGAQLGKPESVTPAPVPTTPPDIESTRVVPLDLSVAVVEAFGRDTPALVRIRVTNALRIPLVVGTGRRLPFLSFLGEHGESDARLVIVPTTGGAHLMTLEADEDVPPVTPVDGCWRLNASVVLGAGVVSAVLGPGESITEVYAVYAHESNEPCLPGGSYRFLEQKPVRREVATGRGKSDAWESVRLGFSVTITEDRGVRARVE